MHVTESASKTRNHTQMLNSTSHPTLAEIQKVREQGDVVTKKLEQLAAIYAPIRNPNYLQADGPTASLPLDQTGVRKGLFLQLQSSLLPQLRNHAITLLESTKPSDLSKEPSAQFQIILEVQSGLEHVLDQISFARNIIRFTPSIPFPSEGKNDQHLKELKSFRLWGLKKCLHTILTDTIQDVCFGLSDLIQQLGLSTKKFSGKIDLVLARKNMVSRVVTLVERIDGAMDWLMRSEYDLALDAWEKHKCGCKQPLEELLILSKPTPPQRKYRSRLERGPLSKPAIELVKLAIHVAKLARIFFIKLSGREMNRKRLPQFATLCSHQLYLIVNTARNVGLQLDLMLYILKRANRYEPEDTNERLTGAVTNLKNDIETSSRLILLYFVPNIPDTDGYPVQTYFKNWLTTWSTLFTLSVNNLLDASATFSAPDS